MNVLLIAEEVSDLAEVLQHCGAEIDTVTMAEAAHADMARYGAFCVLGDGACMDARVYSRLERAAEEGKRVFVEASACFYGIYAGDPTDTTRSRLIYVDPQDGNGIPGLETGDLLDDGANRRVQPWNCSEKCKPILVYKDHIIAHTHLNATAEEILSNGAWGLWTIGENIMMTTFQLHNYNRARYSPRAAWEKLIRYVAEWITGGEPTAMPQAIVSYGEDGDLTDPAVFEALRQRTIDRGIQWLQQFLIDEGCGGIREGLAHQIRPDGRQELRNAMRNDCCGEVAGAMKMYAQLRKSNPHRQLAENLDSITYGPMVIKGGTFDGFMRWTNEGWQVCYQDDVARCVLGGLYDCVFLGNSDVFPEICRALDFLIRTTAKDGCRVYRTDLYAMNEDSPAQLAAAEHGSLSAHYNAYYHAALLLAYKHGGNPTYLEVAQRGLETLMSLYPETSREQSETEEMCRLVLPLAILYDVTREERHREMLYRVVTDLRAHRHPCGGYREWDTGYKAQCSRESLGECSLLTENGDPVADLLYSVNWLPMGFAYGYYATKDAAFLSLWREVVGFCIQTQIHSALPLLHGSWCRAFDMELGEAYGCPHDAGWAAYAAETGWTAAEILMGMMFLDILPKD